jgi:hypothetical protein
MTFPCLFVVSCFAEQQVLDQLFSILLRQPLFSEQLMSELVFPSVNLHVYTHNPVHTFTLLKI